MVLALLVTIMVYWPGLYGGWLFDDYPNIVDNHGVQPSEVSLPTFVQVALSSPASDFKRPLASLSFALNYLVGGLNPFGWKLLNLLIHLLNGVMVYVLVRQLLRLASGQQEIEGAVVATVSVQADGISTCEPAKPGADVMAALIAAAWLLLPINITAVLYVVQREESLANLFVLMGLIAYTTGRQQMLASATGRPFSLCLVGLVLPIVVGVLAKETAIMLPLYAFLIEWFIFKFRAPATRKVDCRVAALFVVVLAIPFTVGMIWIGPRLLQPEAWATRDFTLGTRLLSEARAVCDYIAWILLPTPASLSFYHDEFVVSKNLFSPWTTLSSLIVIGVLIWFAYAARRRRPLVALGIGMYLGSHLLTGTIVPLELVYEHRNYFGSLGLLLAVVPTLARPGPTFAPYRRPLLCLLFINWTALTAYTAMAWGEPLRLAQELANRAPDSPRAQYELGRTYIIYSHYDPTSPYSKLAYAPLERAAAMPGSSILPQQALIFMNARMDLPLKDSWWDSMIAKLRSRKPGVQDESSLIALTQCASQLHCDLPQPRMVAAFTAALDHPSPSARLLAAYGDYAWTVLGNHLLGEQNIEHAIQVEPGEAAYRITLVRMLIATGERDKAMREFTQLNTMNLGGRLNAPLNELRRLLQLPN